MNHENEDHEQRELSFESLGASRKRTKSAVMPAVGLEGRPLNRNNNLCSYNIHKIIAQLKGRAIVILINERGVTDGPSSRAG